MHLIGQRPYAYYNEIDPFAADWIRELIKAGHVAPGEVDTRSIEDVTPTDLAGFTQCHFFAGIAVWSYALRLAGWPDERPVWTGSCPCQPFSAAGRKGGFADERHLWPVWFDLIRQCLPVAVFGEQVASKDGLAWFDLVQTDLESAQYTCGAVDSCSAGFGAPHIRQRLYWLAHGNMQRCEPFPNVQPATLQRKGNSPQEQRVEFGDCGASPLRLAYPVCQRPGRGLHRFDTGESGKTFAKNQVARPVPACGVGYPDNQCCPATRNGAGFGNIGRASGVDVLDNGTRPGPTNGFWKDTDWLFCRDGKWRAVEPGTFPLAHGAANRVGRLRGYGNAINAQQAATFIECFMELEANNFNDL